MSIIEQAMLRTGRHCGSCGQPDCTEAWQTPGTDGTSEYHFIAMCEMCLAVCKAQAEWLAGGKSPFEFRRLVKRAIDEANALPNRIRAVRVAKGVAMAQLASRVGLHHSEIGKLERGEKPLDSAMLRRIADALDCSPEEIAG